MHAPTEPLADNLRMPPLANPVVAVDPAALARSSAADVVMPSRE